MGQTPYWMQDPSGPPPPPTDPEPPRRDRSVAVKIAVALLAVALIAASAVAVAAFQRTNELQEQLDERDRAQTSEDPEPEPETESENPLDGLLDDLVGDLGDLGGGGDPLGGADPELLECLGAGGDPDELFGGGDLGDLFGEDGSAKPERLVRTISKQVEKVRELRFRKPVEADFIPPAQIEKRVGRLFLEGYSKKDAALDERVLEAIGAIERDTDLFATLRGGLEGQVSGFYVPSTEELVVLSGKNIGPLEKITLAHELEHALADQNLGLPLPEDTDPATADADLATLAVIEGDATLTMQRWSLAHLSLSDQLGMLAGSAGLQQSQEELEAMPHYLQQQLTFPYLDGLNFVCNLQSEGGWAAVDRAYDEPPASSDQVLFPERYDPKAEPVDVTGAAELDDSWTKREAASFGAAELKWLFEAPGGDPRKSLDDPLGAVAAWGGGAIELWTKGEDSAVSVALAQRAGESGLCDAVTQWYSASFSDDQESEQGGAALVAEGGAQDALITCSPDEVRIGIGPDLATARTLAG